MAVIQINMGGRPMTVDVPDFAMESTQSDIKAVLSDLATNLTGLQTSNKGTSAGEMSIKSAVDDLKGYQKVWNETKSRVQNTKFAKEVGKASSMGVMQSVAKPGMVTSFMKALGLGTMATAFGMVSGLAKELGSTFAFAGDVGVTFGEDVMLTQRRLAKTGLQLDMFGNIIAQNTGAMRELGGSVEEGSQNFIGILENLQKSSEQFGNFGLAADEQAQFLAEEIDIRRKSMDAEQLRLYVQNDLTDAMVANYREQEKMARVTGQNTRERIRAQMAAQEDVRLQVAMQGMTKDQIQAIKDVTGNLTDNLGPAGKEIMNAIIQGVAVEGSEMATAGGRMAQLDTTGNLMAIITEGIARIRSGDSGTDTNVAIAQLLQNFKQNADTKLFQVQAFGGNEDAMKLMQMAVNINETGIDLAKERNEVEKQFITERQKELEIMRSFTLGLNKRDAEAANLALSAIMKLGGGSDADLVTSMKGFIDRSTEMMSSEFTKGLFEAFGTSIGMVTVQPFLNAFNGDVDGLEAMFLAGLFGNAAGVIPEDLANLMQTPQRGRALLAGGDAFLRAQYGNDPNFLTGQDADGDGKPDLDYNKIVEHMGSSTVAIAQSSIEKLANAFKTTPNQNTDINPTD
tara:strand:- start:847 stop:2724 length:1878 start_codon:yes stop_codon:yes gene_type:complete